MKVEPDAVAHLTDADVPGVERAIHLHTPRLMRRYVIEALNKRIGAGLLLEHVGCRQLRGFCRER